MFSSLSRTRIRFWNRVELSFVLGSIVFEISWDWRYWKRSGVCQDWNEGMWVRLKKDKISFEYCCDWFEERVGIKIFSCNEKKCL